MTSDDSLFVWSSVLSVLSTRSLRTHQATLAAVAAAVATDQTDVRDILAAVTPGGGKSLLPMLAAVRLAAAGVADNVCWVVPRDSLRLQAEEAFADPAWRAALGHEAARGLGKLLVVAPDQAEARRYLDLLRGWVPVGQAGAVARLATADTPGAHEALAAFRLRPEPSVLVTVAMAYEGLDAPEVAVVAALTHIRSRSWLEQMVARATRVDPHAGLYEAQRALVFHPDDPLFAALRRQVETEQSTMARRPRPGSAQATMPGWLLDRLPPRRDGIEPLSSNALALRFHTLRPGPALALQRPEQERAQAELLEAPSVTDWRLRARLGEMVAAQTVEDEAGRSGLRGGMAGPGLYHRYNAVLKRVTGTRAGRP